MTKATDERRKPPQPFPYACIRCPLGMVWSDGTACWNCGYAPVVEGE